MKMVFYGLGYHLHEMSNLFSGQNKKIFEPGHSISYKIAYTPSEDSDQSVYQCSLISVFTEHSIASQGFSTPADGQQRVIRLADLSVG